MLRRFTAAAAVLAAAVSTVATSAVTAGASTGDATVEVPGYAFRVIGESRIRESAAFGGTQVRDISGIDYDAAADEWYLLSDETTRFQPARFYGADLALDTDAFGGVTVNSVSTLRQADGTLFPEARRNETGSVDPEAIRVDPADGSLLWASEGRRDLSYGRPTLIDPTVRRAATDGTFAGQHPTPPHHAASADAQGVRDDRGFEALTLNTNGRLAITGTERPLLQDGATPVRLNIADRTTGRVLSQVAYDLEPGSGLVELLAKDASTYLTLERAKLPNGRYSVRVYEASTLGALSVMPFASLSGTGYTAVTKRLVLDLADLDLGAVRNLEGMAWGPTLPSGERTLVLVSDNDCDGSTQLVALGVTLS